MRSSLQRRDGFTLIELLMVVVIIGILAAIAIPKFAATKDKSKLASVRSDLRNIMSAQEAYYIDHGVYTQTLDASVFTPSSGNDMAVTATASEYTATISNTTITFGFDECSVTVGDGSLTDSQITCS